MLKTIYLSSPTEKASHLSDFNAREGSWIVPDVVSRTAINKELLKRYHLVESFSCMRVSDLWQHLLFANRPDLRVISPALAKALIGDWLKESEFEWARTPGAADTIALYIQELMPILSHPESEKLMPEWFKENPSAMVRWGLWYIEAFRIWQKFSREKLLSKNWVSGLLLNEVGYEKNWHRKLVIDLGIEFIATEIELIRSLSRFVDVTLLLPYPDWIGEYPFLKNKISDFGGGSGAGEKEAANKEVSPWKIEGLEYKHFSSSLAEIKDAVSVIRGWLESGVNPDRIGIITPNRKRVWSTLSTFLKHEGIPIGEQEPDPLSAHGRMGQLLSRLKLKWGGLQSGDLEFDLFHSPESQTIIKNHDEFVRYFSNIYENRDLGRVPKVLDHYRAQPAVRTLSQREFVEILAQTWDPAWSSELFESLLHRVLADAPENLSLEARSWLNYISEVMGTTDLTIDSPPANGILIENLRSSDHLSVTHVYFLNAIDSEFRPTRRTGINEEDLFSLSRVLGYNLVQADVSQLEFLAKWVLSKKYDACVLSYAASDLSGNVQAPSLFWMQGCIASGLDPKKVTSMGDTVWDLAQESLDFSTFNRRHNQLGLKERIFAEFSSSGLEVAAKEYQRDFRLSATAIANYNRCPYIYYIQNLLRLSDIDPLDFDLGFKDLGSLLHFVVEKTVDISSGFRLRDVELGELVDRWARESKFPIIDVKVWQALKHKIYPYLRVFLKTEFETRRQFPKTKTVAVELDFRAEISIDNKPVFLTGRIDRVDTDGDGRFVVIDYKRSDSQLKGYKSWISSQTYQLWLYTMALEQGWTRLGKKSVCSGQFYTLKTGDRTKSYFLIEEAGSLYDVGDKKQNKINRSERDEYLEEMVEVVKKTAAGIRGGKFTPNPVDPEIICKQCTWRFSCRAQHLM